MTCQECELTLAGEERVLVVDGRVEAHMAECSACREFAAELRENSEALQAFAMETLPGLNVSPRELPGIRPGGRPGGQHGRQQSAWWAAVAAVLVLGFASTWAMFRSRPSSPPVLPFTTASAQVTSPARIQETVPLVRRHVPRPPQPAPREPLKTSDEISNEPRILQVKMLTDDPNVVIYWQIEN
jgi:hypothetical protein